MGNQSFRVLSLYPQFADLFWLAGSVGNLSEGFFSRLDSFESKLQIKVNFNRRTLDVKMLGFIDDPPGNYHIHIPPNGKFLEHHPGKSVLFFVDVLDLSLRITYQVLRANLFLLVKNLQEQ